MKGLRKVWTRGPRSFIPVTDKKGPRLMLGKNGGPVVKQTVELHLVPKGQS